MKIKNSLAVLLVAALVAAAVPVQSARADNASTGATATVGLLAVVVGVYFLVGLRSDIERYSEAERDDALARAVAKAEASPVVLEAVTAPLALGGSGETGDVVTGASIGWRWQF